MIIVTGSVLAAPQTTAALMALCLAHTRRSRAEAGCVRHDLFIDAENPLLLFFFEVWADRAALDAHFALEASRAFVRSLRAHAAQVEGPTIYQASA